MTTINQVSDGGPDGSVFGQSSTDKIAFFGGTPIVRPTAATAPTLIQPTLGATAAYGFTTTAQFNATVQGVVHALSVLTALGLEG